MYTCMYTYMYVYPCVYNNMYIHYTMYMYMYLNVWFKTNDIDHHPRAATKLTARRHNQCQMETEVHMLAQNMHIHCMQAQKCSNTVYITIDATHAKVFTCTVHIYRCIHIYMYMYIVCIHVHMYTALLADRSDSLIALTSIELRGMKVHGSACWGRRRGQTDTLPMDQPRPLASRSWLAPPTSLTEPATPTHQPHRAGWPHPPASRSWLAPPTSLTELAGHAHSPAP